LVLFLIPLWFVYLFCNLSKCILLFFSYIPSLLLFLFWRPLPVIIWGLFYVTAGKHVTIYIVALWLLNNSLWRTKTREINKKINKERKKQRNLSTFMILIKP
jgi:hypothetical protein